MIQEESHIQSASVGIGAHSQKDTTSSNDLKPWVLLICGDFGFITEQPQKVSSAMIQDFIQTCGAQINATVDKNLPSSVQPFSIRTSIKAFSDFSNEQMLKSTPVMRAFLDARETLEMISVQSITPIQGKNRIASLDLPPSVKNPIVAFLGAQPPRLATQEQNAPQKGSFADSILSIVDTGTAAKSSSPLDSLISAIGDAENDIAYTPAQLAKSKKLLDDTIEQIKSAVKTSSGYSSVATSWYALRNLLKKIGRTKQISVYINSSPAGNALESYQNASAFCIDNQNSPDFTIWSYNLPFMSLSTVEYLNTLAALADNMKSLLFASIAANDPFLDTLASGVLTDDFEQGETWSAFKCLRNEEHSRSISLCAPSFHLTSAQDTLIAGGAWLLADHWVSMYLSVNTPFNFSALSLTDIHDDQPLIQVAPHKVNEIAQHGIAIFRTKASRIMLAARVVFDSGENESFGLAGFNILVNRVIRLSGDFFSFNSSKTDIETAAQTLYQYLLKQLEPLNILSSANALDVHADSESSIAIAINSSSVIDGNSVQFEFTFDY